jgi:hypothetical protein
MPHKYSIDHLKKLNPRINAPTSLYIVPNIDLPKEIAAHETYDTIVYGDTEIQIVYHGETIVYGCTD